MSSQSRRDFLQTSLLSAGALCLGSGLISRSHAWGKEAVPGVETIVTPLISGEEFNRQPGIWALEIRFKPLRMITVELPDPRNNGKTSKQLVWYLAYRVINRAGDTQANPSEVPDEKPMFTPEFLLVTEDTTPQKRYFDRVIPVAQAAINKRERHNYRTAVELLGDLPALTPANSKSLKSLDGIAMWRGVDPKADKFKVYMTGFSNGYRIRKLPNGEEAVERKTIVQEFWRPGDEIDQHEEEIRPTGEPQWIYR